MDDEDVWFEPKRYGYGFGMPVRWQGWALIGGYLAAMLVLAATTAERHLAGYLIVVAVMTAAVLLTSARHTRGGWRWRRGEDA